MYFYSKLISHYNDKLEIREIIQRKWGVHSTDTFCYYELSFLVFLKC